MHQNNRKAPDRRGGALFRHSVWDAVPAALVFLHLGLLAAFFIAWPSLGWAARLAGAALYAAAIGWNQDSVSHNFIHNPFFTSKRLNRIIDFALTLENGTPQTMYRFVHMRHHAGNSDRPDAQGVTLDPISVYRHGRDGKAEGAWSYVLKGFWRDDGPFAVARQIRAKRPDEARRALQEFWVLVAVYAGAAMIHWDFVLVLAPFYYLGQSLSFLIAYYEHFGARPEAPIATGVSTYEPIYNLVFLNNGYHAEHHYRPKQHWTRMRALRAEILTEQRAAGVRVIGPAHFLGFLARRPVA
ncbi:fatty acid desaturase family protein [Phenylobacterium sp.]|uniref:fatty acid desaturase family protein n=1 Tax=Phenylobacterium sp. TaxID=1871053 RepID=UPI00374DC568